jgi:LEA14-like dessication related protein
MKADTYDRRQWRWSAILLMFVLAGCSTVQESLQIRQPTLGFQEVQCTDLTFEAVELTLNVNVQNPNPVPIQLIGFDYALKINDTDFLAGEQDEGITVAALGDSSVRIPVMFRYHDLYQTFQALKDRAVTAYQLAGGLTFDLPVAGITRVPFNTSGELPAVKRPGLAVSDLAVKDVNLAQAKMVLELRVNNPNAFGLLLHRLNYEFSINDHVWARGDVDKAVEITSHSTASVTIPFELDFQEIGVTIYQMLADRDALQYRLRSKLDVGSSLPLLQRMTLPFVRSGKIRLRQ